MASGFFALLDDVAGIAKLAAASLDDVAGTAGRVGLKAAGVVVDDTAIAPRSVAGLSPERELPIVGRIALGSLRNKLLILLPAALLLNWLAPRAVTPLLMLGGLFLCFEGAGKLAEAAGLHGAEAEDADGETDPRRLEDAKVRGAVRTDLILSAEIMAISLAEVAGLPAPTEALVLALVALLLTAGVYGVVAVVVKVDDVGLHLARAGAPPLRALGRALVKAMPPVMAALAAVGTAAMLWVGGGILVHGLAEFGIEESARLIADAAAAAAEALPTPVAGAVAWLVEAAGSGAVGVAVGGAILAAVAAVRRVLA